MNTATLDRAPVRNTMSAFSPKEVAFLLGNQNVTGLKIHPLKAFIAEHYPQAEWDQAYVMAWQVLSSMTALARRCTTAKVSWFWGVPYTPRSYLDSTGQEAKVHCIAASEEDERQLTGVWKHENTRLIALLKHLVTLEPGCALLMDFGLSTLAMRPSDARDTHQMLTWRATATAVTNVTDNVVFLRTSMAPRGEDERSMKVKNSGLTGAPSGKPASSVRWQGESERREASAYRGQPTSLTTLDESPFAGRKQDGARRHDRRKKSKQRSRYDD